MVGLAIRITSLMLALLWLPASAHCQIELLSGLEILACGTDTATHHDTEPSGKGNACEDDVCAELESGLYKIEDNPQTAPLAPHLLVYVQPRLAPQLPDATIFAPAVPDRPPAALAPQWQFLMRSAAPPRAPSSL